MDNVFRKLTDEDLAKISGGTFDEYDEFTAYLFKKYGVDDISYLDEKATQEEKDYAWYLLTRDPNEPRKPYPQ